MNDIVYTVEDILMAYEAPKLSVTMSADYEDVSNVNRSIYNDNARYYDIWVTSEGNDNELIQDVINKYEEYDTHFQNYLSKNDIEFLETEILTDDEGGVTFSVTISE